MKIYVLYTIHCSHILLTNVYHSIISAASPEMEKEREGEEPGADKDVFIWRYSCIQASQSKMSVHAT